MSANTFLTVLAITLVSLSSYACPDLSGEWLCQNDQPNFKIKSVTSLDTNFLEVTGNYDNVLAEKKIYILGSHDQKSGSESYSAMCRDQSVVIDLRDIIENDRPITFRQSFKLEDQSTLNIGTESSDFPSISTICKRFSPLR